MTLTRRTGALAALALTLVLGACSTPADVSLPGLEAQFGTSDNDSGIDVAYNSSGHVYVLAEEEGGYYESEDDVDPSYWSYVETQSTILRRFDNNGNLLWDETIGSTSCNTDYVYGSCDELQGNALVADSRGNSYSSITYSYEVGDCAVRNNHYVRKYNASGNYVQEVYVGTSGGDLGSSARPTDLAIDGSGNLYVVKQEAVFLDECYEGATNSVAKYSPTGTLLWRRTSPVGTLYGVTVSSSGLVYVGGSTGVAKYTNSGDLVRKIASGDTRDVAAVGTNTVYARNLTTVRKLDANGKQLWSKAQTGLSGLVIGDMTTDGSANVYITGKYGPSSNRDVFVRKLSASSGTTAYSKVFATSAYDDGRGIATLTGSEIYVTGETQGSLAHANYGGGDGYLRKMDVNGNRVWTR